MLHVLIAVAARDLGVKGRLHGRNARAIRHIELAMRRHTSHYLAVLHARRVEVGWAIRRQAVVPDIVHVCNQVFRSHRV